MHIERRHFAALDGLRFVAAFTVMVSHLTYHIHPPGNFGAMSTVVWNLTHLANFGMTLFFVLSGFVIHWNYRSSVTEPGGLISFFVARWSRLYPLFLVVFLAGLIYEIYINGHVARIALAAPYFLTFTTTWWYWQIDGDYVFSSINNPFLSPMWSLSTEAFFYLLYPALAPLLRKLDLKTTALLLAIVSAIAAFIAFWFSVEYMNIASFARDALGVPVHDSFLFWLGYHSPWMRLPSFLIGILIAQLVITGFTLRPGYANVLAAGCLLVVVVLFQERSMISMVDSSAAAICFGGLCLAACTTGSVSNVLLRSSLMAWGGEASYSLYLLHNPILSELPTNLGFISNEAMLCVAAVLIIIFSRVSYSNIERPAQKYFRSIAPTPSQARRAST